METGNENEWEIRVLQQRYEVKFGITLSKEQAEKVYTFEQDKMAGFSKYYFSDWEELDYEEVAFKEILTPAQFGRYMSERPAIIKQIEESLLENDQRYIPQLKAAEELVEYYRNKLIPSLNRDLLVFHPSFSIESDKINFIKAEHSKFLKETKRQILIEHFRHSKTLQPTSLKFKILQHEQSCLLPGYFFFKSSMDIATKAVADYLQEKYYPISKELLEAVKQTMAELKEFNTQIHAKYIGEQKGWHTIIDFGNDKEQFMYLLLLDHQIGA